MENALQELRQSVPQGGPIFIEYQTSLVLRYYLCRDQVFPADDPGRPFLEFDCGDYRLISPRVSVWEFTADNFFAELEPLARMSGLRPGDEAWIVHAGWNPKGTHLRTQLAELSPGLKESPHRDFGANICLFQVRIGSQK